MADNRHRGSTLDEFLAQEGVLEEFQARAIKEVVAWQLAEAMRERKLSKNQLAKQMHTSRTQVDRMLDPEAGNVTIETLQRAAALVGRRVQIELVEAQASQPLQFALFALAPANSAKRSAVPDRETSVLQRLSRANLWPLDSLPLQKPALNSLRVTKFVKFVTPHLNARRANFGRHREHCEHCEHSGRVRRSTESTSLFNQQLNCGHFLLKARPSKATALDCGRRASARRLDR